LSIPDPLLNRNSAAERVEWSPSEVASMASDYYLLKTEPTGYSFADLQRDSVTEWDGVSNPVALRNLREMKPGTKLVIYETGDIKSAVGTASVVKVNNDDPKNPVITLKAGKMLKTPVSLAEMKADSLFEDSPLVRQGRLSVVPLTSPQYKILTKS
jgi:predicted RNA-binding protein with PUA-like domain